MMKKHDFQNLVDIRLSYLVWDAQKQSEVLKRIREEEEPMKKRLSLSLVVAVAVMCLSLTALAAGLTLGPGVKAAFEAEKALNAKYGLTQEMYVFFHRDIQKQPDGSFVVSYNGIHDLAYVLGEYTVCINGSKIEASWTHDGKKRSSGFDTEAWGAEQLNDMIQIHKEEHSTNSFTDKARAIAEKHGIIPEPAATPAVVMTEDAWNQQQDMLSAESEFSTDEFVRIARTALQTAYQLNSEQLSKLVYVPEMSFFHKGTDDRLFYTVNLQLLQNPSADPSTFSVHIEKDGVYSVTIDAESGLVDEILYESPFGGNG